MNALWLAPWRAGLLAMFALMIAQNVINGLKYGQQPAYHMWSGKLWSIVLVVALASLFLGAPVAWAVDGVVVLGVLNSVEGIVATLFLPRPMTDVPTVFPRHSPCRGDGLAQPCRDEWLRSGFVGKGAVDLPQRQWRARCWVFVGAALARDEETNVFGVPQPISASLMGAFYDLKQTPKHRLTGTDPNTYSEGRRSLPEPQLGRAGAEPLFPDEHDALRDADFHPEHECGRCAEGIPGGGGPWGPSLWVVHYKGQVSPPSPGCLPVLGRCG